MPPPHNKKLFLTLAATANKLEFILTQDFKLDDVKDEKKSQPTPLLVFFISAKLSDSL